MPPKKAVKKKSTTKSTSVYQPINFYELEDVKKLMPKSINPEYKNHKIGLLPMFAETRPETISMNYMIKY